MYDYAQKQTLHKKRTKGKIKDNFSRKEECFCISNMDSVVQKQEIGHVHKDSTPAIQLFTEIKKKGKDTVDEKQKDFKECDEKLNIKAQANFKDLSIYILKSIDGKPYQDAVLKACQHYNLKYKDKTDYKVHDIYKSREADEAKDKLFSFVIEEYTDQLRKTDITEFTEAYWAEIAKTENGGAYYNHEKNLIVIEEGAYTLRNLLHELGHFIQFSSIKNLSTEIIEGEAEERLAANQLLEYHNIILHENLYTGGEFSEPKYMKEEKTTNYKRVFYNTSNQSEKVAEIQVKADLKGSKKHMAENIILGLINYDKAIKEQIYANLLKDCSNYFEKKS